MILGIGTDLTDIRRIERALLRFGARFTGRVFTQSERAWCDAQAQRASCYAKRYAAKEAAVKALGVGIQEGVFWRDVAVRIQPNGQPRLEITGGAARHLDRLTPSGYCARLDVSLSDEYPLAQAMVVLSAEKRCDASLD